MEGFFVDYALCPVCYRDHKIKVNATPMNARCYAAYQRKLEREAKHKANERRRLLERGYEE